jgi:hypothetical protein
LGRRSKRGDNRAQAVAMTTALQASMTLPGARLFLARRARPSSIEAPVVAGLDISFPLLAHACAAWRSLDHGGMRCRSSAVITYLLTVGGVRAVREDCYRTSLPFGRGAGHKVRPGPENALGGRVVNVDERHQEANTASKPQDTIHSDSSVITNPSPRGAATGAISGIWDRTANSSEHRQFGICMLWYSKYVKPIDGIFGFVKGGARLYTWRAIIHIGIGALTGPSR